MVRITIITVVLNNKAFIKDAIESVLSQSYTHVEYIIIDGGSTDGSLEVINAYKDKVSKIISESDKGIYDAMNKGLAIATGHVIGFLNADDFYTDKNVIDKVVKVFEAENCDALYADLDYVNRKNKSKVIRKWRSGIFDKNKFLTGWMPPHPTFFVKSEIYKEFGGFNEGVGSAADYELMLRFLYVNSLHVYYLPQVIIKMRVGGQSNRSFRNRLFANIQDRKAWAINGVRSKWYTFLLKPLSKIGQYFN